MKIKPYKRFYAVLLAVLLCLGGCRTSQATTQTVQQVKIGLTLYQQDDTFISSLQGYLESAAKAREAQDNIKISLNICDANGNQSIQNDQVERFISQGCDVICVNEVDRTAASVIIDKAKAADIPIVFFNREPVEEDMQRWKQVYYVGSRPREAGILQADIVAELYRKNPELVDRNQDGRLQYVMLEGEPGHQDAAVRTEYAIKELGWQGIEAEKLANEIANWQRSQAFAKVVQWIEKFGDSIEVVFSNNDDMALGAIDAYQSLGIKDWPIIVGIDATPPALEALRQGTLAGTVFNDARGQGQAIFELAYALATDRDVQQAVPELEGQYVWKSHTGITLKTLEQQESSS